MHNVFSAQVRSAGPLPVAMSGKICNFSGYCSDCMKVSYKYLNPLLLFLLIAFLAADYHPSQGWMLLPHHLSKDQLWKKMKEEAKHDAVRMLLSTAGSAARLCMR